MRRVPARAAAAAAAMAVPFLAVVVTPVAQALEYTCDGQTATIVGTDDADTLVGTDAADVIVGLGGKDVIDGLGGDDRLCGGRGVDTIDAGPGDDTVYGGADGFAVSIEGDFVEGGPGDDELHGGLDPAESGGEQKHEDIVIYAHAPHGVRINLDEPDVTGDGHDTIDGFYSVIGSEHDDVIVAGAETDVVHALGGADTVTVDSEEGEVSGGGGDDVMRGGYYTYGNAGDDDIRFALRQANAGQGDDLVVGTQQRDIIRGGPGNDVLRGRGGNDYLAGEEGRDRLVGGRRNDRLEGGSHADRLSGGVGADVLEPGDTTGRGRHAPVADDRVRGGAGRDTVIFPEVFGAAGVRVDLAAGLATRVGRDRLQSIENASGGPRGDDLLGDGHRNFLLGLGGDDHLVGRGGRRDFTNGGDGTDRCEAEVKVDCER